ncbi:unnamed protein product [Kuraishia capsulata CBS 1993]|uniref:Uncharacterized protein n=1 Tax=Kuraishia capsulata CBS 1993 TaxID=1382522 RepID=W6MIX8_9ASCO|nr:uncharacterized protein KUCA_T00001874001 [Kuraishia capsulata CBS 1993]CDK25903.1 unnamed protein product [Kuraishia capsulata CBS 1993]
MVAMVQSRLAVLTAITTKARLLFLANRKVPVVLLLLVAVGIYSNMMFVSSFRSSRYSGLSHNKPNVDQFDYIPSHSRDQDYLSRMAISAETVQLNYKPMLWTGYSGDLDITDLAVSDYSTTPCRFIQHKEGLGVADQKILSDDLASVRKLLIATSYSELVTQNEPEDVDVSSLVNLRWARFSGASVWLADYNVHLLVSRVMYAKDGVFGTPTASFIRAQVYDRNWNELMNYSLKLVDSKGEVYKQITFPTLFDVGFNPETDRDMAGAEDPKIALRVNSDGKEEPVIFFNMFNGKIAGRRAYHAYLPFSKHDYLVGFSVPDVPQKEADKDWVPFFARDVGDSGEITGFVYFIYQFNPLTVIKCSMDYGECHVAFQHDSEKYPSSIDSHITMGSNLILLPQGVPTAEFGAYGAKKRDVWVGFSNLKLYNCGCGDATFRPSLFVLILDGDNFRIEFGTTSVDFGLTVAPIHSENVASCQADDKSILTVGSVGSWDVTSYDKETHLYEDYMSIVLTEADRQISVVRLTGVLNYILGSRRLEHKSKRVAERLYADEHVQRSIRVQQCALYSAKDYCTEYAAKHSFREEM